MGYTKLTYDDYMDDPELWQHERGIDLPAWANEVAEHGGKPRCALDFYLDVFGEDLEDRLENLVDEDIQNPDREWQYTAKAIEMQMMTDKNGQPILDKNGNDMYRGRRITVTKDLDELFNLIDRSEAFCMIAPISYVGKRRVDKNARYLYALALEVDNIRADGGIDELFYTWERKNQARPKPTYIVCSGNGVHLYFIFERPIPLYANIFERLKEVKKWLTPKYWTANTTTMHGAKDIQWEGLSQPFRCVGSRTKGSSYTMAFEVGDKVTIEYLNRFLPDEVKINEVYKSKLPLAKAKKLYPEWYRRRIEEGQDRGHWHRYPPIYYNWIRKIYDGAEDGHRYNCLENLCSLAVQCQIPPEQVENDCREIAAYLETLTRREDNHFGEYDVICALQTYHEASEQAYRRRIEYISNKTGIELTPNKRNGRRQNIHIKYMNNQRAFKVEQGECSNGGRPDKETVVRQWCEAHPHGRKADCIRDTGLSKPTVYRWWPQNDEIKER